MEGPGIKEESRQPLLDVSRRGGKSTSTQTLGNIVVSIMGAGILGLPFAFRVSGWLATAIALLFVGLVCCFSMLLLVESRRKLEEDTITSLTSPPIQSFGDLGSYAFGSTGRILTELIILVSHAGASVTLLLFIGQNLSSLATNTSSTTILFLLLPLELALSFIRSLSFLSPFSALATFCNVCAILIVLKEDINHLQGNVEFAFGSRSAFNGVRTVPFACAMAVFCYQGFGMTLPLEGAMDTRRRFPWVLMLAFVGLIVVYVFFGGVGYLAFGEETNEIVTLNLTNSWSEVLVKIGLCTASAFTLPLIVHPIHEIMELKLKSSKWISKLSNNSQFRERAASQVVRLFVVVALTILATSTPGFAQLISFTGSTICTLISFVLPPSLHLKIVGSSLGLGRRLVDWFILLFGLVFALYGTYTAIYAVAL